MIAANGVTARYPCSLPKGRASLAARGAQAETLGPDRGARRGAGLQAAPRNPMRRHLINSCSQPKPPIPRVFPTSRSASSSSWVRGNTSCSFPGDEAAGPSASRSRITPTPPPEPAVPRPWSRSRLLKAALADDAAPYGNDELADLARHCTDQEDAAEESGAAGLEKRGGHLAGIEVEKAFDAVRWNRPSEKGERVVRLWASARRGKAGGRGNGGRGSTAPGATAPNGRGTGIYRFQSGGVRGREPVINREGSYRRNDRRKWRLFDCAG